MTPKSCFILGLPSAGKTTYLAALAYSLEQTKVKTKLHWNSFTENHQYLAHLAETWLTGSPVSRTSITTQQMTLTVEMIDDADEKYSVTFPDFSGETFQNQYKDREIGEDIANAIKSCDSIMLFINPSEIHEPVLISELPVGVRQKPQASESQRDPAKDDPTEVQLVELLQFVDFLKESARISLAVIVSAWDIAKLEYQIPETCVKARLPLLWQYLKTNSNLFFSNYYGVSAQGGKLEDTEEIDRLLKDYRLSPAERICVADNKGEACHDISLPLWKIMNDNRK